MSITEFKQKLATLTDEELAQLRRDTSRWKIESDAINNEINRRHEGGKQEERELEVAKAFNPRCDVSADARYLWTRIFIWFWVVPAVVAALIYFLNKI
jgi:hypothetical protein